MCSCLVVFTVLLQLSHALLLHPSLRLSKQNPILLCQLSRTFISGFAHHLFVASSRRT